MPLSFLFPLQLSFLLLQLAALVLLVGVIAVRVVVCWCCVCCWCCHCVLLLSVAPIAAGVAVGVFNAPPVLLLIVLLLVLDLLSSLSLFLLMSCVFAANSV